MKATPAKISLILLTFSIIVSCNAVKRVGENEYLITKNSIYVDGEETDSAQLPLLLYQPVNTDLLGIPLRLHLYNLAKPQPDSSFAHWLNKKPNRKENWIQFLSAKQLDHLRKFYSKMNQSIKKAGEPPSILDKNLTQESAKRLQAYFFNHGWFNAETSFEIQKTENKRARIDYFVTRHQPYLIDSITTNIASAAVDSLYNVNKKESFIQKNTPYNTEDFNKEAARLTRIFQNQGLYYFEKEYISFIADTVNTDNRVKVELVIKNRDVSRNDSIIHLPFKIHTISRINVVTDYSNQNEDKVITHKTVHENYHLYSYDELKYKPEAITDAIFIKKGEVYKERDRTLTYNRLNGLGVFNYPDIQYIDDPEDTTNTKLIANIFLTPKKKFELNFNSDVFHSNIQDFGIGFSPSFMVRNLFGGAEILQLSARGSIGSSADISQGNEDVFFDVTEIGADLKLTLPKIAFPLNMDKIIPKYMSPFTVMKIGMSSQQNIGLDKRNYTGALTYQWQPSTFLTHQFNLIDLQYVRNLNPSNYFNIYKNAFSQLNDIALAHQSQIPASFFDTNSGNLSIPEGTNQFISAINHQQNMGLTVDETEIANSLIERKKRLTENNLIIASNFSYIKNTRENIYDKEFTRLKIKLEFAGNTLSLFAPLLDLNKTKGGKNEFFGVQYSQYVKLEVGLIKHWQLAGKNVLAFRAYSGIALPYGNSNSIPFSRSFFAGGANDNRGWRAYDLGPGSTGGVNEFNDANFKLAFNLENRFNLFNALYGALFIDAGNIWHVEDNVTQEKATFTSFNDFTEIAIGSGFGLRYDVDFFAIRVDLGFKTYDPSNDDQKWFRDYNFSHAILHFGINYPF